MLDRTVSNRIAMLRPLLIIAMVFSHMQSTSINMSDIDPGFFNHVGAFFIHGIARGTVPTMSMIAGFLLFSMSLDLQFTKMVKKKMTTLVIPFIAFNLAYVAYVVVCDIVFKENRLGDLATLAASIGWFDVLFGFGQYPVNAPLYFVRDLIVFSLMAPLLGGIMRTLPVLGLAGLIVIFGFNHDGNLVFRSSSLILFYIGGMAAVYKWDLLAMDKYAKPCAVIFLLLCLALMAFKMADNTILVMAAPFLIWPAASLLSKTRIEAWGLKHAKYSFFIFAAHMPLMELTWLAVTGPLKFVPYIVYWAITPFAVSAFLMVVYNVSMRVAPTAFNIMVGARPAKPKYADRRKTARPVNAPVYSAEERMTLAH